MVACRTGGNACSDNVFLATTGNIDACPEADKSLSAGSKRNHGPPTALGVLRDARPRSYWACGKQWAEHSLPLSLPHSLGSRACRDNTFDERKDA
jgi:hypothetical protein